MFPEINAAVDTILLPLQGQIPRRRLAVFGSQLANILAVSMHDSWNRGPKTNAMRVFPIIQSGDCHTFISMAASLVSLDVKELCDFMPDPFVMSINPGGVQCRYGTHKSWVSVFPRVHSPSANGDSDLHDYPSLIQQATTRVPLSDPKLAPQHCVMPFFVPARHPTDQQFTVGTFALTRFGSTKSRMGLSSGTVTEQYKQSQSPYFKNARDAETFGAGVNDACKLLLDDQEMASASVATAASGSYVPQRLSVEPSLLSGAGTHRMSSSNH